MATYHCKKGRAKNPMIPKKSKTHPKTNRGAREPLPMRWPQNTLCPLCQVLEKLLKVCLHVSHPGAHRKDSE